MQHVIVGLLYELAPLRQCTRPPKAVTKFLLAEAIESKRRRLERRWRQSRDENDRIAYRCVCRRTNNLIHMSGQNHFKDQLLTAATPKDRWCVAKELLHST
jgi:hypothetical protein